MFAWEWEPRTLIFAKRKLQLYIFMSIQQSRITGEPHKNMIAKIAFLNMLSAHIFIKGQVNTF